MPAREKGEFYKKDRKVLRFFCKYKDSRLQGDKRDYILYYYLLNDTIEIKEVGKLVAFWLLLLLLLFSLLLLSSVAFAAPTTPAISQNADNQTFFYVLSASVSLFCFHWAPTSP